MTVHCDKFLVNKTNRFTSFIGIMTLHVLGSLSAHHQEFLAIHRLWYILCSFDDRLPPVLLTVCYQEQDGFPSCSW